MLLPTEVPAWLEELTSETRVAARGLRPHFHRLGKVERIPSSTQLVERLADEIIYVEEGRIDQLAGSQLIRYHCDDDILWGIPPHLQVRTEFASECVVCPRDAWTAALVADPGLMVDWMRHLERMHRISDGLVAMQAPRANSIQPKLQRFAAGQNIIEQGEDSSGIFVMITGEADVLVDGVKVGRVSNDEIFGEMGYFSGELRSSTVVARAECTVQVVPGEEFCELLLARPQLVTELVRTQCQRLRELNSQVSSCFSESESEDDAKQAS